MRKEIRKGRQGMTYCFTNFTTLVIPFLLFPESCKCREKVVVIVDEYQFVLALAIDTETAPGTGINSKNQIPF